MQPAFFADQTFNGINYTNEFLPAGEYDNCIFIGCEFSHCELSEIKFLECTFTGCNLSLCKMLNTVFIDAAFKDCKMLGLHFENCADFRLSFHFENCILNHSSFYKTKIKKTVFSQTVLHEVDFTECDLTGATFSHCDLLDAHFEKTILEKADLTTAHNYTINPQINSIKKAKFSLPEVVGLLTQYDIHIQH